MSSETNIAKQENDKVAELEKELKELPEEERGQIIQKLVLTKSITYEGAVPPPEMLREFDKIIPNGADRFMKMAENQTEHRIRQEKQLLNSELNKEKLGLIFGFIISLLGLSCSVFLAYNGNNTGAGIFAIPAVAGLVNAFLNIGKK